MVYDSGFMEVFEIPASFCAIHYIRHEVIELHIKEAGIFWWL